MPGSPATAVHQPDRHRRRREPAASPETPAGVETPAAPADPGFLERGGLRRRLRFLRKTRELAYRDLGGLVFEMHRLGQERKDLLTASWPHSPVSTRSSEQSKTPCTSAAA